MWTQSKELHNLVESTINRQQEDSLLDLEKALKTHRSDFSALLKHPVRKFVIILYFFLLDQILILFIHICSQKMQQTGICWLNLSKNQLFSQAGKLLCRWIRLLWMKPSLSLICLA